MTEKNYDIENYNPVQVAGLAPQDSQIAHDQNNQGLQEIIQKMNIAIQDIHARLKGGNL